MESKKPVKIGKYGTGKRISGRNVFDMNGISPTIMAGMGEGGGNVPCVSDTQKSTDMQPQSTENVFQNTKTMEMQQLSMFKNSQISTFSLEGFLAKLSALLEKDRDSWTQEEHYFLKSHGFLIESDPDIFYSRTLKAYLVMTIEKLSSPLLVFSPTLGIPLNGRYLILRTMDYRRTEKESFLRDVLEKEVDQKYFLSEKMQETLQKEIMKGRTKKPIPLLHE